MKSPKRTLIHIALLIGASILLGASSVVIQGPLPGDIHLTKMLQTLFGSEPTWAKIATGTATHPVVWVTLAFGSLLAYARSSWRGITATVIAFICIKIADSSLRALIYVPRPSAELVSVVASSTSSGLPSTSALVYGAIFGTALLAKTREGWLQWATAAIAACLLTTGVLARIVLGSHWMSQMLASLLLTLGIGMIIHEILQRLLTAIRSPD